VEPVVNPLTCIRSVRADDIGALAELDQKIFDDLAYPHFVLRQLYDVHEDDLLVLDDGTALRGYSIGVRGSTPRLGWILGLGVEPIARRRGFAERLAQASFERLRGHDVERVRLTVNEDNAPAVGLYHKLGFRLLRRVDDYLGPGEPRLLLELRLDSPGPEPRLDSSDPRRDAAASEPHRRPTDATRRGRSALHQRAWPAAPSVPLRPTQGPEA
jgi:ribosomal protein S18 acetylase RimI-like enzyme